MEDYFLGSQDCDLELVGPPLCMYLHEVFVRTQKQAFKISPVSIMHI